MSRLADPTTCPDCRGRVSPEAVCTACGLTLTGPLSTQLWRTMLTADDLVERLRREHAAVPADSVPGLDNARPPEDARPADSARVPMPPMPAAPGPTTTRGLPGRTVPAILLGLGGLFVFVAVSLFLAVTWQVLPLAVKAVMMVGFTAGVAAVATVLSRKGLRGSAEAIWALVAALVALDLGAAHRSGLFGLDSLSGRTMTTVVGTVLVALGLSVGVWARSTRIGRCVAAEITLVVGLIVLTVSQVWTGPGDAGVSQSLGVPALVGIALLLRTRLREASYGSLGLAVLTWANLAALGALNGATASSRGAFWNGIDGWQLLVAAALAAAVTLVRVVPVARTTAAGACLAALATLVLLPWEWDTLEVLLLTGVLLVLAGVVALGSRCWASAAGVLGSVGVAVAIGALVVSPLVWVLSFVERHQIWTTPSGARFPIGEQAAADCVLCHEGPSAWTVLALLAAAGAVVVAVLFRAGARGDGTRALALVVAPGAFALAVATGLAGSRLPLWVVVAGLAAAAAIGVAGTVRGTGRARLAGLLPAAEAAALALVAASRSDLVTGVLGTVLAVAAGAVFALSGRRTGDQLLAALSAAATVLLTGYAAAAWTLVAHGGATIRAELLVALACVFLLAAAYVTREPLSRLCAELSAGLVGVAAIGTALPDEHIVALVLTVLGSAVALVSVLHTDRVNTGWLGAAVLTVSTLVRLDAGTSGTVGPEVYTLPAAALLIGAGVHRLLRDPGVSTWRVLGSGLTLALGPTVLLALPDPSSLRALLVGAGAAVALGVGIQQRWQAPFLVGTGVLGLLALRFLGPLAMDVLANPLGAWMLFGSFGAACLTAGILWEQSLRNLKVASRYLAALR
ncbi:MAG: SCO7613 C-terminal domain-containing membrane protein [Marmoricola sp.]